MRRRRTNAVEWTVEPENRKLEFIGRICKANGGDGRMANGIVAGFNV